MCSAHMQSAIEKSPNKYGPGEVESDAFQMSGMRSISREVSSLGENRLALPRQFIAISFRILMNPVLISVLTARARARSKGSSGQSLAAGNRSAAYSQIASAS